MKSLSSLFGKKTGENGAGTASNKARGLTVHRMILPAFVVTLAAILFAAAATYMQFALLGQDRREALSAGRAEHVAALLAGRLQGYADVVETKAHQQAVAQALATADTATLERHASELQQLIPEARRVRFLRLGEDTIDEASTPSMSYACLDLARAAEAGKVPPVEIHLFGNKQQHIALVRPVEADKGVVGSLLVSFDVAALKDWLQHALPEDGGYAEIRQAAGAKYLTLAAAGNAGLQQTHPGQLERPVAGTGWQLVYWTPETVAALSTARQGAFFTVFAVAVAVVMATFIMLMRVASRVVKNDLVAVVKQGLEMWDGRRGHTFEVKLAESLEVLVALEQRFNELQPKKAVQPNAAKAAAMQKEKDAAAGMDVVEEALQVEAPPMADADLPSSLMFMSKDSVQVEELGPAGAGAEGDKEK